MVSCSFTVLAKLKDTGLPGTRCVQRPVLFLLSNFLAIVWDPFRSIYRGDVGQQTMMDQSNLQFGLGRLVSSSWFGSGGGLRASNMSHVPTQPALYNAQNPLDKAKLWVGCNL